MLLDTEKIPKTLVISGRGYIGRAFANYYKSYDPKTLVTHHLPMEGYFPLDVRNPNKKFPNISLKDYQYALIATGCAQINICEKNPAATAACNVYGIINLVKELLDQDIISIVFSSDYVFDGYDGAYDENALVSPLNEYGRQKAELESELMRQYPDDILILRLGKVFGTLPGDRTLLDEMATALLCGNSIRAAFDQIFCPIHIDDVIQAVIALQKLNKRGLYNLCGEESISRYDLAIRLCILLVKDPKLVERISLNDLNEDFIRPKNTTMKSIKIRQDANLKFKKLESSLKSILFNY